MGANVVGDTTNVWKIGNLAILTTAITLTHNISYGYEYSVNKPIKDNDKLSGGKERVARGLNLMWTGEIPFGLRDTDDEAQLWKLNLLDISEPHIFYENQGTTDTLTQYAYLCWREDPVKITREDNNTIQATPIRFTEII